MSDRREQDVERYDGAVLAALSFDAIRNDSVHGVENRSFTWVVHAGIGGSGVLAALAIDGLPRVLDQPFVAYGAMGAIVALVCAQTSSAWHLTGRFKHVIHQVLNAGIWGGWSGICFLAGHPEAGVPGIVLGAAASVLGSILLAKRENAIAAEPKIAGATAG